MLPSTDSNRIEIFISYSHKDEPLLERLLAHLSGLQRAGVITVWHGRDISAGEDWRKEIDKYLATAQVVLLLVSADFIASDYCYGVEFERAMARYDREEARVISILLGPCDWENTPLKRLQVLPRGAAPITEWPNREKAFASVTKDIRQVVERLRHTDVGDRPGGPKGIGEVDSVPGVKYTLALVLTIAMIALVAGFIGYYKPQSPDAGVPQASPSATPPSTAVAKPSASVSPHALKIAITEFPPYNPVGGPDSIGHIAGTVEGSRREEYCIVIFSYTNLWYLQPSTAESKTAIDPNGSWRAEIKTGPKYAVLLVPRNYQPPNKTSTNPTRLDGVVLFMEIEGKNVLRIRQNRNAVTSATENVNTNP